MQPSDVIKSSTLRGQLWARTKIPNRPDQGMQRRARILSRDGESRIPECSRTGINSLRLSMVSNSKLPRFEFYGYKILSFLLSLVFREQMGFCVQFFSKTRIRSSHRHPAKSRLEYIHTPHLHVTLCGDVSYSSLLWKMLINVPCLQDQSRGHGSGILDLATTHRVTLETKCTQFWVLMCLLC